MQYVVFGNTGMLVSRFTLGGMTLGTRFEPAIVDALLLVQDSFNWVRQSLAEPESLSSQVSVHCTDQAQ